MQTTIPTTTTILSLDDVIEVTSVIASSEGDYEAHVSIAVGETYYDGTVILREDTSRPSVGRRLGTCGAPLDGWASDQVIDALAAAERAGLDRVAIVGEIEAHVTEAAARFIG